jgi:hypothetical protein
MPEAFAAPLFGLIFIADLAVLVGIPAMSNVTRLMLTAGAFVWLAAIAVIANAGGFGPGVLGPVPGVAPAIGSAVALGLIAWALSQRFKSALLSLPLPALILLHAPRIIPGAYFVMLTAEGRLGAPFGPLAGWGDIAVGVLAPIVALLATRTASRPAVGLWNALGVLDLIVALSVGVLSAPGALRVFMLEPGTLIMGALPWVLVPTVLVPILLLTHLTIAAKLRSSDGLTPSAALG